MSLDNIKLMLITILFCNISVAMPPVDFLQSCKNSTPANASITMTLLDGFGPAKADEDDCKDRFDANINGLIYGAMTCHDQPYLVIADKKISTAAAKNYSMNPSVTPNIPILRFSQWWRINKEDKSYLCIQTPLSDTGSAANAWQYYLIENAFDENLTEYNISYYFFDTSVFKRF